MTTKTRFATFLDLLTLLFLILGIFYFAISKITNYMPIKITLTIFLSVLTFITLLREINKRKKHKKLTLSEEKKSQEIMTALKFGDPSKIRLFWINLLEKQYHIRNYTNYILIIHNNLKAQLVYDFSLPELSLQTIQLLISKTKVEHTHMYILANSFSTDAINYVQNINNVTLLDSKSIFLLLKEHNYFPKLKQNTKKQATFKSRFLNSLNRNNSFKFIRYSILIYILSLIIPFATYYKVIAFFLFALSIISLFRQSTKLVIKPVKLFEY